MRTMYLVALSLTIFMLGQASQPASQPVAVPASEGSALARITGAIEPVSDQEFERLLEQLKHPRFAARQEAVERLQLVRGQRLPALVRRYRDETSFEVKRALRQVIEHLFYRKQIVGERGFLGIRPTPVDDVVDPVTGESVEAMEVVTVIDDHAAQQAGMKAGDLIVAYDGEAMAAINKTPLPDQPDTEKLAKQQGRQPFRAGDKRIDAFTQKVKTSDPGREIPVRILRPVPTAVELVDPGQADLREFLKSFRYVGSADGFVVRDVMTDAAVEAIGLKKGDLIVRVNGQTVSSRKKDKPIEEAVAQVAPPEPLRLSVMRPTLREVSLKVVLGTRPMNMINPTDELVLKDRFARWWLEQEGEIVYTPSQRAGWQYPDTSTQPASETDLLP